MPTAHISHVALGVRDVSRTLPFWTEVVGLHVTLDTIEEAPGIDGIVRRRAVYLRQREGAREPFIVLDELLDKTASGEARAMFDIGVHHFGFWVDDVDRIAQRIHAAGIKPLAGPVDLGSERYGEKTGTFVRTLLVADPEGNTIQFDQRIADDRHDRSAS
ncbi:VOC family protein [Streptomyces sp. NPDC004539]|uniref:VOC family protein n=1 Tax=Streptomyces sp. NPDC004539 TaxID=3154280 RepID=UPI0033BB9613